MLVLNVDVPIGKESQPNVIECSVDLFTYFNTFSGLFKFI
jgi:hypothetical protein